MHNQNEAFLHLNDALPADIARRRDMGDLAGALRLIDARLSSGVQPLLAPRLEAERLRLTRLPYDYPYTRPEAVALVRAEWPGFTEAQFDALLDGGRIDWRMVDGELRVHREFLESLRIYPKEAPGLVHEAVDNAERDAVLARMEREGSLTARITLKADIRALVPVAGQEVQAWLPLPAACPQQSNIELLDCTPGGVAAPEYAPQRTMWWKTNGVGEFSVTYRYLFRAEYTAPMSLSLELAQPDFDLEEQPPHIVFTPYLRALAARLTEGCANPAERRRPSTTTSPDRWTTAISPPTSSWTASPTSAPRPSGGTAGCSPCSSSPCAVSRASPPGGRAGWPSGPAGWAPTTGPCSTWPPTAGCGRTAPSAPPPAAAGRTPAGPTTSAAWTPGGW